MPIAQSLVVQDDGAGFLRNRVVFVFTYLAVIAPTYVLPYAGSNSSVLNALGAVAGVGALPQFWMHVIALYFAIIVTWVRGTYISRPWISIFPFIAALFDLIPGFSLIPLAPTLLHIVAMVVGVSGTNNSSSNVGKWSFRTAITASAFLFGMVGVQWKNYGLADRSSAGKEGAQQRTPAKAPEMIAQKIAQPAQQPVVQKEDAFSFEQRDQADQELKNLVRAEKLTLPAIQQFLARGARKEYALLQALILDRPDFAEYVLDNGGNVNASDGVIDGWSPLFFHAQSPKMLALLLARGAALHLTNRLGQTVIHFYRDPSMVELALSKGASATSPDKSDKTPLLQEREAREKQAKYLADAKSRGNSEEVQIFERNLKSIDAKIILLEKYGAKG